MTSTIEFNAATWRREYRSLGIWNKYQLALLEQVQDHEENLCVEARAGTGKTTTIFGFVAALPASSKIAVFAFNRHIAENIQEDKRIPNRVAVGTAHSFGLNLVRRHFIGQELQVVSGKYTAIAKKLIERLQHYRSDYEVDLAKVKTNKISEADLKRKWGEVPPPYFDGTIDGERQARSCARFIRETASYAMKTLTPVDDLQSLKNMIAYYEIDTPTSKESEVWGLRAVKHAIAEGERQLIDQFIISFDEMLYFPWKWQIQPPQKDWIIVDEAQDANPAQIALYESYVNQGANIIYVGDSRQAIMGFSGADCNSWRNLAEKFHPKELPLPICYRCPDSHLKLARRIVPDIETSPEASDGEVKVLEEKYLLGMVELQDLLICRMTAPLISLCLSLIVSGKRAIVRGRSIGRKLIAIANKAKAFSNWPESFKPRLKDYFDLHLEQAIKDSDEELVELLNDQWSALLFFYGHFMALPTAEAFIEKVESLFDDEQKEGVVILSTIHRAKGDQANRVFIVGSQLLPFTFKASQDWQKEQEMNLTYVALTRAKETLFLVPYQISDQDTADKLKEWNKHPYGGMRLPETTSALSHPCPTGSFDPLDLEYGAKLYASGLTGELLGFDFKEDGSIFLHLKTGNNTKLWINSEECQLIHLFPNATLQVSKKHGGIHPSKYYSGYQAATPDLSHWRRENSRGG